MASAVTLCGDAAVNTARPGRTTRRDSDEVKNTSYNDDNEVDDDDEKRKAKNDGTEQRTLERSPAPENSWKLFDRRND